MSDIIEAFESAMIGAGMEAKWLAKTEFNGKVTYDDLEVRSKFLHFKAGYQAGAAMQREKDAKLRKARREMKCTKVSVNGKTMWEEGISHE